MHRTRGLQDIPDHILYGREIRDVKLAASREFLMKDGIFRCSSSFAGNLRRYHGLFIEDERIVLSSLHETINGISLLPGWWGEQSPVSYTGYSLSAELYPVVQEFALPDLLIRRTTILDQGLIIRWEIEGKADMQIRPLMTDRTIHELSFSPSGTAYRYPDGLKLNGYPTYCTLPFTPDFQIYYNACYPGEEKLDYMAREDLASPGFFSGKVRDETIILRFEPKGDKMEKVPDLINEHDLLKRASELCLENDNILTGYPWNTKIHNRDTFISLPGLLLAYNRYSEAEDIFRGYLDRYINRKEDFIPGSNTDFSSDTPLWFFWAFFQYLQTHQNSPFVDEVIPQIEALITTYPDRDAVELNMDLISVPPNSTWMNSTLTPREGKPVEVNALWILALEVCKYLEIETEVTPEKARDAFTAFWNEKKGYAYDVLDPNDPSLRPNQVIALAFGLLRFDEGRKALEIIREKLLTPFGLRSLARGEPGYIGRSIRDPSYHNGMVWPWLTGWYIDAMIQYGEPVSCASRVILPAWHHFFTDGAGMLPELFDGDPPHNPAGSICHACSIAEMIRARNRAI